MVVDFHSHILPCVDDGSRGVQESIAMLRLAAEQGIHEIVLTPHFYPRHSTPEEFLEKRNRAFQVLINEIDQAEGLPKLRCGAEVYFYPQMSHSESLVSLKIEGTDCILVEMPMMRWTDRMYRELEDIRENLGLTPIIAHVDRYLGRFRDFGIPRKLEQLPVLVQANASFFLSRTGSTKAFRMLNENQIHVLGSDCHNTKDRAPNLGVAIERIIHKLGLEAISQINSNEQEILGTDRDGLI